ncbi:hypothetical protein M8C21_017353, partial [Ambrosia artemisiifolia]
HHHSQTINSLPLQTYTSLSTLTLAASLFLSKQEFMISAISLLRCISLPLHIEFRLCDLIEATKTRKIDEQWIKNLIVTRHGYKEDVRTTKVYVVHWDFAADYLHKGKYMLNVYIPSSGSSAAPARVTGFLGSQKFSFKQIHCFSKYKLYGGFKNQGKTGHVDLCMSVYDDFKKGGSVEQGVTFMILIKGLCKAGRVYEAIGLLDRMRKLCKPDVFAYTAMVRILVSEGYLDGCLRLGKEMERDKVQPDVMAYATLVTGLCKGNRVDKGYEFFKEMKEKRYLIDRTMYGSLIEAFVNNGKVGMACELLEDLINSGYRADLVIYNHLIRGLCTAKHVSKAHRLFKVTVEEDLKPDFETVNPMLVCYAESRKFEMTQKPGVLTVDILCRMRWPMSLPSVVTYMVMDDLAVKSMSTISTITLLNKLSIKDDCVPEEKEVQFGTQEGLKLLKASL